MHAFLFVCRKFGEIKNVFDEQLSYTAVILFEVIMEATSKSNVLSASCIFIFIIVLPFFYDVL